MLHIQNCEIGAQILDPQIIEIDRTQIPQLPKVTFWYKFFTRCEICGSTVLQGEILLILG